MEREATTRFDPGAVATDVSDVLTALAGITELGSTVEVSPASTEPLQSLAEEVASATKALAKKSLEGRAEVVGVEDSAIEKARQPIERLPLEDADHSSVVGTIRDVKSGEAAEAGKIVAKDTDGQVIGEGVVDSAGNFAIELTTTVNEVHIEALDEAGRSVSVSTVELVEEEPAAHFVEMLATGRTSRGDGEVSRPPRRQGASEVLTDSHIKATERLRMIRREALRDVSR